MSDFSEKVKDFDETLGKKKIIDTIVPYGDGNVKKVSIKNNDNEKLEEYYRQRFCYGLIESGLFDQDKIGIELAFPKGNVNSAPLKIDVCIFDDKDWHNHYKSDDHDWLRKQMIGVAEMKGDVNETVRKVFNNQLKPAMKENDLEYCWGAVVIGEGVYMFFRDETKILRYDGSKNVKGENSILNDQSLDQPDSYLLIPNEAGIKARITGSIPFNRAQRQLSQLDIITGVNSSQIQKALHDIICKMDQVSLRNVVGYNILVWLLTMKFYDENENDPLKFYIEDSEFGWTSLNEQDVQTFIVRMDEMLDEARAKYPNILENALFDCQSENYVKLVCQIVKSLQDFNFSEADTTDVHQLVFSNLGNAYQQIKLGQYITPLPIIEFLVDMINPKEDETIVDPTLGLGDFLAQSFNILDRNGKELNDSDLYGIDNDENMIMLAQLNLLLCGAGGVVLRHGDSKLEKFDSNDRLMSLVPSQHKNGKWDNWATRTILKKFDIVMTNPPFGSDRSWKPEEGSAEEKQAEMYQTWNDARNGKSIDMGVIFLENAVRSLRENGRMAIVLSNSIASVATWKKARDWFFKNMRVVATFDLPSAFVDATVRTTLVIAYKPSAIQLKKLQKDDYEFFTKRIEKIGYKVKTISGVTQAVNNYKRDENFEYVIGEDGERIIDSEFNEVYENFYGWAEKQEKKLKEIFLD